MDNDAKNRNLFLLHLLFQIKAICPMQTAH